MTYTMLSVVLPVYNQADHIGRIVDSYGESLVELPVGYEIIVVVNGSTDQSLEVCNDLARRNDRVKVLTAPTSGWGHAVRMGVETSNGDLICYTNSARTSADELVRLVRYALSCPDVVVKANRKLRENWRRRIGSLLFNIQCRTLFDLATWDVNGTPKIFPRTFERLLHLTGEDDLIDAEFNMICRWHDYPMIEVPIFSVRRHGGRSSTNWGSAIRMYLGAFRLWRAWRKTVGLKQTD